MQYNNEALPKYLETAGKITIVTALAGVAVFLFALVFDFGSQEFSRVSAQSTSSAPTFLTVLNTPPSFSLNAYEVISSATTTPTNSGDVIEWTALANDSNDAPYFLLICSTNATPTANAAASTTVLGTVPPTCSSTSTIQWGVSTSTPSDTYAVVSTTTAEGGLFNEVNTWFAWVCDDDPFNPRCNNIPVQGPTSTSASSSPFHVNSRPLFSGLSNNGPVDPGATLTFTSTSSDDDLVVDNDIILIVCETNTGYSTTTNQCAPGEFIASTTISQKLNATAAYNLAALFRDDTYPAYGYIIDEFGHEALGNPIQADFDVNNVAPVVLGGDITLNGINPLTLTEAGGETTGFTLEFSTSDANSCVNFASTTEMTDYVVSLFRSSYGTTTCNGLAASYNPNYCYPSGVATTTWNLACTSDYATSCTGPTVDTINWSCTFPLWFVADPTDNGPNTPVSFEADIWVAAVAGVDDNFATGTLATTTNPKELISFAALDLLSGTQIPYGSLEPGQANSNLSATTTVRNLGNTGLDQLVEGESMCKNFSVGNDCAPSASSTIPENQQKYSSSSLSYTSPAAVQLSSTTPGEVEIDVLKTTSTNTLFAATGTTYWGIAVPGTITLAGIYQGLNTFTARVAEAIDWTP